MNSLIGIAIIILIIIKYLMSMTFYLKKFPKRFILSIYRISASCTANTCLTKIIELDWMIFIYMLYAYA